MTIEYKGRSWELPAPVALLVEYRAKPPIARQLFFLGCERCRTICAMLNSCACCDTIGSSTGGKRVRGLQSGHVRIPVEVVLSAIDAASAA